MKIRDKTLHRTVSNELRNCIAAHGPITKGFITSATKRISNAIHGLVRENCRREAQTHIDEEFILVERKDWDIKKNKIKKLNKSIRYWMNVAMENDKEIKKNHEIIFY